MFQALGLKRPSGSSRELRQKARKRLFCCNSAALDRGKRLKKG
jgi:hypothetical protein